MSGCVSEFFQSLVLPGPRPYAERARIGQKRVRDLLRELGEPHRGLPGVHIAGSKGKGSTALFVEAILRELGYSTGTFLSPHLERWNERFLIDGEPVEDRLLQGAVETIAPKARALLERHADEPPSFFDALTACAFLLFREQRVDYGIFEAGLGGRYDATTIVESRVCCITSIELEHVDKLGDTLGEIARHKAGIIKPGVPVVVGDIAEAAAAVIASVARGSGAPIRWVGDDFETATALQARHSELRFRNRRLSLHARIKAPNEFAARNAGLAVQIVTELLGECVGTRRDAVQRALESVVLPGRTEIVCEKPLVILDAAHTEASARGLTSLLDTLQVSGHHLLLSMSAGKALESILAELLPGCARVVVTQAEPTRSMQPQPLADAVARLAPGLEIHIEANVDAALDMAYRSLAPDGVLCVTGSVYLAGAARRAFRRRLG